MNEKHFEKVALVDLVFDPAYQALPNWPEEQMATTIQEIKAEGDVRVPVVIDEANRILDGHQRVAAAKTAKVEQITCERVVGLDEDDKLRYVIGQLNRRHLSRAELRKVAEVTVARLSKYSDSRISLTIGIVSDKTVREIRKKLIAEGTIPDHETLIGLGGSPQPAHKTKTTKKPADKDAGPQQEVVEGGKDGQQEPKPEGQGPQEQEPKPEGPKPQEQEPKPEGPKPQEQAQPEPEGPKPEEPKPEPPAAEANAEPPKPEEEKKDKKSRKPPDALKRSPLVARLIGPALLLEGMDLVGLPQDLTEVECLVVLDAKATHVKVTLDTKRPTLVIFRPLEERPAEPQGQ